MEVNPDLADSILKVGCMLCNYLHHEVEGRGGQDDSFDDADSDVCLQEIQRPKGNRASAEALRIRDTFKQYFVSPAGQLPRQCNRVHRGLTVDQRQMQQRNHRRWKLSAILNVFECS